MNIHKSLRKRTLVGAMLAVLSTVCAGFTATTPVPTNLSPASVAAGGGAFTLKITGNGFSARDQVEWNGSVRATSYINRDTLSASITATDVATAGSAKVVVTNGSLRIQSAPLTFTITANSTTPSPLSVATTALSGGVVSTGYSATLSATGGTPSLCLEPGFRYASVRP